MHWFREPFFDPRPAIAQPASDGLVVAFASPPFGTLATPPQLPEDFPDMPCVKCHPEFSPNDLGDTFQGPQVGLVTSGRRSGQKDRFQATQIVPGESTVAACSPCACQCSLASCFPEGMPTTGGLTTDTQFPSHVGLRRTASEQLGCTDASLLFGQVVAAPPTQGRSPFHGGCITSQSCLVTRFCETQ